MTPRERAAAVLAAEVAAGRLPGAVVYADLDGAPLFRLAIGRRDPVVEATMAEDAIFRIYSMTKPLVSVAALILMEEGRLQLADPVARYLPGFADMRVVAADGGTVAAARPMRVHDLLTHTSGLSYGARGADGGLPVNPRGVAAEDFVAGLAAVPLGYQPGTAWDYGFSTDVLGLVIERISGQRLGAFLEARICAPLGMRDTGFHLDAARAGRLAEPHAVDPLGGAVLANPGQRFDPTVVPLMDSGGAGALSTAADYLRFANMLLAGGTLAGVRILSPAAVRLMTADHLGGHIATPVTVGEAALQSPGYGFGLGVAVRLADGLANVPGHAGDYFWSGTAGTTFWVDPVARLSVVFMAQAPGEMRLRLRRMVRALVYQALS